jgi:outer membrane receptor for ferrienterochelin and colicins
MRIKILLIFIYIFVTISNIVAQKISGYVYEVLEGSKTPLIGANVHQAYTTNGTATDELGFFEIKLESAYHDMLVFSYVGYLDDTVHIHEVDGNLLDVVLRNSNDLSQVDVVSRQKGGFISRSSTRNIESISSAGLKQAACCNLSESFENSATVNISYADAVTGAKHIEMLGLAGQYTQILQENIPNLRGLATPFGLGYYPGDWLKSIQVSKGSSSVINGFESITGQINLELKKPDDRELFFLNIYGNQFGKLEGNMNGSIKLNEKWSTMLLLHGEQMFGRHDLNGDSFLDMPVVSQINAYNRWNYKTDNTHLGFGVQYLTENREGGQLSFDQKKPRDIENGYGIGVKTDRFQSQAKLGYIFKKRDFTSIGFQNQFIWHRQNSFFGLTDYDAEQLSYYSNLIFQSYIKSPAHKYTTGFSYVYDSFDEILNDSSFTRIESIPGIFFQYTYSDGIKWNFIGGVRGDLHNLYGFIFTPRLHVRYSINEKNIIRASAGRGYNSVNVIAENTNLFNTSKKLVINGPLKLESAWNMGLSYNRYFNINDRELSLGFDLFYTYFIDQVIVDRDSDPFTVYISNLNGKSYSTSFQAEMRYEIIKNFDVTLAFRYNDVKTTINNQLRELDMVNRYKGLISLSYFTNLKKWQFDLNTQINGDSRLPNTSYNPAEFQRPERSPIYAILNAQITKYFKRWDIYVGGENLTNYRQPNPIIDPENPFGDYFDATIVYAPVMGIKVYAGIRFKIEP